MEEFFSRLSIRNGKGTWILILIMFLICLLTVCCPQKVHEFLLFNPSLKNKEIWRLVSPVLMHSNLGHFAESACWLIFLGYQIEDFFGTKRFFAVIFFLSLFSNFAQYWFAGSNFCGFSSVSIGLGSFLWRREVSYREKYFFPILEKLVLFAGFLFVLLSAIFISKNMFCCILLPIDRMVQIAGGPSCMKVGHASHMAGFLAGWILGGIPLFRQRRLGGFAP